MRQTITALALSVGLVCPSFSEDIPSDAEREERLVADLEAFGRGKGYAFYDMHKSWSFDANCDGKDDQLVQVSYSVSGGNGVALHYLVYEFKDGRERRSAEIDLSGGIKKVARDGADLIFTLSEYRSGDPRCCPTGEIKQRLSMCKQP